MTEEHNALIEKLNFISKSSRLLRQLEVKPDLKDLHGKQEKIKLIAEKLKSDFAGLDKQIDKIIDVITPWYIFPQAQKKPIVVSLWGMTGVGKTSFVKALSKELGLEDRFISADVSRFVNYNGGAYSVLAPFYRASNQQAIFLFDEIHTARAIDSMGHAKPKGALQDLWTIADTGQITKDYEQLNSVIMQLKVEKKNLARQFGHIDFKKKEDVDKNYYSTFSDHYMLQTVISDLSLDVTSEYLSQLIMEHPPTFIVWALEEYEKLIKQPLTYDFSKSLIFFSGNLDEAFTFSFLTNPDDINAEELHKKTKVISKEEVKSHLFSLFRPEQISRFGNLMLIFPSLSAKSFRKVIANELSAIQKWTKSQCGIDLSFKSSVVDLLFNEGVIPVQGARSVLSYIKECIEPCLTNWVIQSLTNKSQEVSVEYDEGTKSLVIFDTTSKDRISASSVELKVQILPKVDVSQEFRMTLAAHEAGHAVVGIVNQGRLPIKIISGALAWHRGGPRVVFEEFEFMNLRLGKDHLQTLLAGTAAERMFLGADLVSDGCGGDLQKATALAGNLIQNSGMAEHFGVSSKFISNFATDSFNKKDHEKIEEWLSEAYKNTEAILIEQKELFEAVATELMKSERLTKIELATLVKKHFKGEALEIEKIVSRKNPSIYESYPVKFTG